MADEQLPKRSWSKLLTLDVTACARCGEHHARLHVEKLWRAQAPHTHWATCPKARQPVLLELDAQHRVVSVR